VLAASRLHSRGGLRAVALLEFTKGLLVLLIGFGLISLARRGMDLEDVVESLLYVLHVHPHRHLWDVFLRASARLNDTNLIAVAAGAAVYSLMRFVEAYGLWRARVWAQWLALISGAVYLPLEVYELLRKATPAKWALLSVNVAIVLYMVYLRMGARPEPVREA